MTRQGYVLSHNNPHYIDFFFTVPDKQTERPEIAPGYMAGGSVELGHVISLGHPNKSRDLEIFYTTDGTQPSLDSPSTKV